MNEIHEAEILNNEMRSLESERRSLMASAAVNATGFGKRKGFPSAVAGVGKDAADLLGLSREIQEKTSELSLQVNLQNRQEGFVKQKERALRHVQDRINRLGC